VAVDVTAFVVLGLASAFPAIAVSFSPSPTSPMRPTALLLVTRRLGSWLGSALALAFAVIASGVMASCAEEEAPNPLTTSTGVTAGADGGAQADGAAGPSGPRYCTQARAESLPARLVTMSAHASSGDQLVLVSDVYNAFVSTCGICHGTINALGGFQIASVDDFTLATIQKNNVIDHITSKEVCPTALNPNDPNEPMPPCGQPNAVLFSQRGPDDQVRQFEELLSEWIAAGGTASFTPASTSSGDDGGADGGGAVTQFSMTPANADAMTNLGNCIPSPGLVDVETTKSKQLDDLFAAATSKAGGTPAQYLGLPEKLSQTDLFTLDSSTLAEYGVVAYQPAYPLWSDDAGKVRYVRVPRGQSIKFNKETQSFDIPPNTRFYKTFMKQIADTDGSYRYRKIETRLIVARQDTNNPDGTAASQNSLFGTYKWADDESDATLVQGTLYNGNPFPDTILSYNTDEQLAAAILAGDPLDPEEALLEGGALRHYAIPSSQRCVQCHMGSPSQDFVLGFTPLQINRRATGVGGTIPDHGVTAGADELTQLQRLIDYGVITGIDSLSDVKFLEDSQGSRAPRDNQELVAQGYMLGNCAHCHNPRGYPTSIQPLLTNTLDFLPSATTGGIFQFPLERYSPDIFRGELGTTPIPFITPSLMDLPHLSPNGGVPANDPFLGTVGTASDGTPTLRYAALAPWRSLIYRNTSSAFTYGDPQDVALYPHMPMNTPGFDPRVRQIMGDWMVSIPAVRKHPELPEYAFYTGNTGAYGGTPDTTEQPYVEVTPDDPRYPAAQAAAVQRLIYSHGGANPSLPTVQIPYVPYSDPGNTGDIIDLDTELNPTCHPTPNAGVSAPDPMSPNQKDPLLLPFIDTPHWVVTDLSQLPGYTPRRADWANILVSGTAPSPPVSCASTGATAAYDDQLDVVAFDQSVTLDATFTSFANTPRPMGVWQQKAGCDFSSQHPVSYYTATPDAENTQWMTSTVTGPAPSPSAPVYEETPGAEVFKMICINCHGKRADSNGFIAQNLANLTGGLARVADFRDGFLGPVTSPGDNRHAAFGAAALPPGAGANWTGVTDDDRAARYMAWMALGGTEVLIPTDVLQIVGVTPVLGVARDLGTTSANMLASAKGLCLTLLGSRKGPGPQFDPTKGYFQQSVNDSLILGNGDAELWMKLCTVNNPSPVHIIEYQNGRPNIPTTGGSSDPEFEGTNLGLQRFVSQDFYLANGGTTVGDENAKIVSVSSDNKQTWPEWPWCLDASAALQAPVPPGLPVCPAAVSKADVQCLANSQAQPVVPCPVGFFDNAAANKWAVRGAMNAGFSVYMYLKSLETMANPPPDYNQCELLQ
jgi:mono/diheme cytochrome c family protein